MPVVRSRGFEIAFDVDGDGPVLTLLPGLFMGRSRWHDVGYVDALRDRFRLVTIDPLGSGDSDKALDVGAYAADLLAADTIAVLDAADVRRTAMWGYSRGAGLAADVAVLYPERVSALIAGGAPILIPRSHLPPDPASVAALRASDWPAFWDRFGMSIPVEVRERMESTNDPQVAAALVEGTVGDVVGPDRVRCPIMQYVGGGEWFWTVVRDEAEQLGSRFHQIGELGHAETFMACDTVVPLVDAFLRDASPGS